MNLKNAVCVAEIDCEKHSICIAENCFDPILHKYPGVMETL